MIFKTFYLQTFLCSIAGWKSCTEQFPYSTCTPDFITYQFWSFSLDNKNYELGEPPDFLHIESMMCLWKNLSIILPLFPVFVNKMAKLTLLFEISADRSNRARSRFRKGLHLSTADRGREWPHLRF